MARHRIDAFEDESPGHIGGLSDNLGVHEVAQSDKASRGRGGNSYVVEHLPTLSLLKGM